METTEMEVPICKTQICKKPLTWIVKSGCWRCLRCNPIREVVPTEKPEGRYVDVIPDEKRVKEMIAASTGMSEDKIREIVQDELANWHIQRPPATRDEIDDLTFKTDTTNAEIPITTTETWRQKAKRLGVALHRAPKGSGMRTKIDVLAEIQAVETKESAETDETTHSQE